MIEGPAFALFLGGALLLNITPGPDMAFTLASSARGGARAGIAAALGVGAGSLGWAFAAAAGLAAMLAAWEHALTVMRIAGGAYLFYLAMRAITEKQAPPTASGSSGIIRSFRAGVLTNLLNPKVGLFFLAFLPGFVSTEAGDPALQILLLGALFSFTGTCVLIMVAMAASVMRARLVESPGAQAGMKALSASVYGALGLYLLTSDSKLRS